MGIVITTSRKPSQKTRSFVKDLGRVLNVEILNRGKTPLKEILKSYNKVILVGEYKGNPGKLLYYDNDNLQVISTFISSKLQREVCGKDVFNNNGIRINFNNLKEYEYIFTSFFKDIIDDRANVIMNFEPSKSDNIKFFIQFYKENEKIGPLIIVKSIKIMDIDEENN